MRVDELIFGITVILVSFLGYLRCEANTKADFIINKVGGIILLIAGIVAIIHSIIY